MRLEKLPAKVFLFLLLIRESFGSEQKEKRLNSDPSPSFEEKKVMTTGDGGMICSNDASNLKNIRARRWVGMDKDNWKKAEEYTDANFITTSGRWRAS